MAKTPKDSNRKLRLEIALDEIRKALEGLHYGSLTVTVQDGIVMQIDVTTKERIDYSALHVMTDGEGI